MRSWPTGCWPSASPAAWSNAAAAGRPAPTRSPTRAGPPSRTPTTTWPPPRCATSTTQGGEAAVVAFAEHRAQALADILAADVDTDAPAAERAEALAESLTAHGYAASTESATAGVQLCQHHCPVAHVAAEFPQLCEAETRAFERVLGTYVQRLATIAHGDGVCTTHVPLHIPAPSGRT